MSDAAAAPLSWWGDLLGSLAQPLRWLWEQAPFATHLVLLAGLIAVRALGWHLKFLPVLGPVLESLAKSPDLAACFPGRGAQRRLHLLLADKPTNRAMQASEAALARWFGGSIWSPQALDKALQVSIVYPLFFLALVWVATGSGYLGTAQVLPAGVPWLTRSAVLLGSVLAILAWVWLFIGATQRWDGWRGNVAALVLFGVVGAGAVRGRWRWRCRCLLCA